jgi:hypothetical protein
MIHFLFKMLIIALAAFLSFCPALILGGLVGGYTNSCFNNRLSNKETLPLEDSISNGVEGYGKTIYLNSACSIGSDFFYRRVTALDLGKCIINVAGYLGVRCPMLSKMCVSYSRRSLIIT